ncbi:uncharacterized protein LOC143243152 [Tachypleus tridentatus]|uniref:uncharacterized protein LOC143243152 n=1 Tax=Tachypleus tridentatus TaxID=6853 RepID=UPI003FD3743E
MHSLCKNGACACRDNFTLFQNVNVSSCISDDRLDTRGISDEEWSTSEGIETRTMIPIIVVLGIMFIGMCVALQLFSRARFRNQRTIFNSPHPRLMHIKLGKKRKSNSKRSSHLSLHVPVSRRPSASNYSQRSHPSPRSVTPSGSQEVLRSPMKEHPESSTNTEGSSKGEIRQMKRAECSVNGPGTAVTNQVEGPHSSAYVLKDMNTIRSQSNAKSPSPPTQV